MNTQVTATGMKVKAAAEGGIVISNATKGSWTAIENATTAAGLALFPTSTSNFTNWYHNRSNNADDANAATAGQGATGYDTLTLSWSDTTYNAGVGYVDADNSTTLTTGDPNYVLMNKFYIRSSGDTLQSTKLYINSVNVTSSGTLIDLDRSLRVGVKIDGDSNTYIFAPIQGSTATYYVAGASSPTTPIQFGVLNTVSTITSITNSASAPIEVQIFIWYEGEDANCKSTNISGKTVDELNVSVVFGTTMRIVGTFAGSTTSIGGNTYYKVGDSQYYADTATYTEGTTKFFTADAGLTTATQVTEPYSYSAS